MLIFTLTNYTSGNGGSKFFSIMIRKITLFFFLLIGLNSIARAVVRDTATIHLPPFTDTTCVGTQLMFTATQSSDTFSTATFKWYTNSTFTGVTLDTFYTTALSDGDTVYCVLNFINSAGVNDSDTSGIIIVHHAASIPANVLVSLTVGSNPDCSGRPLTFTAYPVNGGTRPVYQWMINGVALAGEDSSTISRYFSGTDTVSVMMVSNSPCAPVDTVYSAIIPIIHSHLTEGVTIAAVRNPVCAYWLDTLTASAYDYGSGVSYQWYVNNTPIFGAVSENYYTDSLHNGDTVYCVIMSPDTCVLNPVDTSNLLGITVNHVYDASAYIRLSHGSNPGCLDSPCTFTAVYDTFGTAPFHEWFINGVPTAIGSDTITRLFNNTDIVSFRVRQTDNGCYSHDSVTVPGEIMVRDSTPVAPRLSLIGDMLVVNDSSVCVWYFSDTDQYRTRSGRDSIIPGTTDFSYHPRYLGYYYVVKYNGNCPSLPSNIIYISLLGVNELNKANIKIYPNPTNGMVQLDWGNLKSKIYVDVYNSVGQAMLHEEVNNQSHHEANLSNLPEGNYYIVLRDDQGNYSTNKITLLRK